MFVLVYTHGSSNPFFASIYHLVKYITSIREQIKYFRVTMEKEGDAA